MTLADGVPFLVLIVLLWRRPEGLFGNPAVSRPGSVERPARVFPNAKMRSMYKA